MSPHLSQQNLNSNHLPRPENKLFYPAIDGLRAVAAILVFLQHYVLYRFNPIVTWGWTGVDIFFVLSGFLITGILFDTQNDPHRFRTFYIRRALRIFPLYFGVFLVALLTTPLFLWEWKPASLLYPLYLGNYAQLFSPSAAREASQLFSLRLGQPLFLGHLWSLAVEEQFYFIWPCVVFIVRDRVRLLRICGVVIVSSPVIRIIAVALASGQTMDTVLLTFTTLYRMDALLVGGAVALLLRGPAAARLKSRALPAFWCLAGLLLISWVVAVKVLHQTSAGTLQTPWIVTVGSTLVDLMSASVLLLAIQPGSWFYRKLCYRPLRLLGQRSYGFYIFHYLLLPIYVRYLPYLILPFTKHLTVGVIVLPFLCTVGLSFLSFRYFEAPFLRLKSRFAHPERSVERLPEPVQVS